MSTKEPLVVSLLRDKVERWTADTRGTVVYPREAAFEKVTVSSKPAFLTYEQLRWEFDCLVNIFTEQEMTDKRCDLYRQLKGMECGFEICGVIHKSIHCVYATCIYDFMKHIPDLKLNGSLMKKVSSNNSIIDSMKELRAESLLIMLYSGESPPIIDKENLLQLITSFYQNPKMLKWLIHFECGKLRLDRKFLLKVFDFLNSMAEFLVSFSKDLERA